MIALGMGLAQTRARCTYNEGDIHFGHMEHDHKFDQGNGCREHGDDNQTLKEYLIEPGAKMDHTRR